MWLYYLGTVSKLLFSEPSPEAAFWRIDRPTQEALRMRGLGWEKFRWAMGLLASPRGAGWNWQVKGAPPLQDVNRKGRKEFLWFHVKRVVALWFALDAITAVLMASHFREAGQTIAALGLWRRVMLVVALAAQSSLATKWQYSFVAVLGVWLGLSEPKVGFPKVGYRQKKC
jgi:hypothetical protein